MGDQIGAPTLAREIAAGTLQVLESAGALTEKGGVYHLTAGGETSWHEFAKAIVQEANEAQRRPAWMNAPTGGRDLVVKRVTAITTAEYPTPARRPAFSVLSNNKIKNTFDLELPDWHEQLRSVFRAAD